MLHKNISRVIRWYKGLCCHEMHKLHADFEWQARFHDHIIRDGAEYRRIDNYIKINPANWCNDNFH